MKKSPIPFIFLSLALCLYEGGEGVSAQEITGDKPNIIFIFADDWGWGDLSVHGNELVNTPNIDKLASQGTNFHQFSVSSPVCSPSRVAAMTGQFPERHVIDRHFHNIPHHIRSNMPDWLDTSAPMLPKMLQQAGYATAHYGKWHLTNVQIEDAPMPTEYGFDEYGAFNLPGVNMPPAETADRAVDFIERNKDQAFFLNLWIHETHTPHYPEPMLMKEYGHLPEQQMMYSTIIAAGDRDVGKIMDALDRLNIADNTLIIFSSDNGPEITGKRKFMDDDSTGSGFGTYYSVGQTQGLKGKKRSLYAGGIRVPFIARWPNVIASGVTDKQSVLSAVDLLPTFVSIAGATMPSDYQSDGENVIDAFKGNAFTRSKPLYWVWPGGVRANSSESVNWPTHGFQADNFKLLINHKLDHVELYDVQNDWYEKNNIAQENPEIVQKLTKRLDELRREFPSDPPATAISKNRALE